MSCGCNNNCDPCTCASNTVVYEGGELECIGVNTGDNLETILDKINEYICNLQNENPELCSDCITYCGTGITCNDEDFLVNGTPLTEILEDIYTRICSIPEPVLPSTTRAFFGEYNTEFNFPTPLGSPGTIPTLTFTVTEKGFHDIHAIVNAVMVDVVALTTVGVYVNGVISGSLSEQINPGKDDWHFNVSFMKSIELNPGDVVDIKVSASSLVRNVSSSLLVNKVN